MSPLQLQAPSGAVDTPPNGGINLIDSEEQRKKDLQNRPVSISLEAQFEDAESDKAAASVNADGNGSGLVADLVATSGATVERGNQ